MALNSKKSININDNNVIVVVILITLGAYLSIFNGARRMALAVISLRLKIKIYPCLNSQVCM